MDFVTKMEEAMTMMRKACEMNEEWSKCMHCPFVFYCNVIEENNMEIPSQWVRNMPD